MTSFGWQNPRPPDAEIIIRKPRNPEIRPGAVILSARAEPPGFDIEVGVAALKAGIGFDLDIDRQGEMPDVISATRAVVAHFEPDFSAQRA